MVLVSFFLLTFLFTYSQHPARERDAFLAIYHIFLLLLLS
jgi:hypothetical protein